MYETIITIVLFSLTFISKRSEVLDFILIDSKITVCETSGPKGYPFIVKSSDSKKTKKYVLAAQRYHYLFCGFVIFSYTFGNLVKQKDQNGFLQFVN
jgi:hypothetical protein